MKKLSLFAVALSLAFGLGAGGWNASDARAEAWKTDLHWTDAQKQDLEDKLRKYHTPPVDSKIVMQAEEDAKRLLNQVEHDFNNISSDGKDKKPHIRKQ